MAEFNHGLVIGKFYPPHKGHGYLIAAALKHCESVTVLVCDHPSQALSGEFRAHCIRDSFSSANVIVVDDTLPEDRSDLWAENTLRVLGEAPDAVFTSESYGDAYAAHMGCAHVLVDQPRANLPIAATQIRADLLENLEWLLPAAKSAFIPRICVVGAESTGTTTLSMALAEHYRTSWVPEYGREYWINKLQEGTEIVWSTDDFLAIAHEQARQEDALARDANRLLICDTDPFATSIWHERYLQCRSEELERFASARRYALHILTGDEIPFEQDGFRDGEHIRHWMHEVFQERLKSFGLPHIEVSGSPQTRLQSAIAAIDGILACYEFPTTRSDAPL